MSKFISASEYCNRIFDGTHDTPKPVIHGHPLITSKNILGGILNLHSSYNISEDNYNEIQKRSKVSQWDILFSMIGSVGEIYLEKSNTIPYAIKNVGVFSCGDEYKAKWLYYYLKSPQAKQFINNYLNGAVQKFLPLGTLRKFPVIPFENKYIEYVDLLFSIDKKIEFNNRINAELEAVAKTIYDYWFVQFDFPDKNGKPYKASGGKMVWNEELKREIPEGWEVRNVGDIANIKAGGDKPDNYTIEKTKENNIPIYSNGIINDGLYGYTNKSVINEQSVTISARGTIGFCVLRNKPFVPIIRLITLTPNLRGSAKFFFETLKNFIFENSGSVQQQLTIPQVKSIKILYPEMRVLKSFDEITSPILDKSENLKEQNQQLASLRDWLLPMLMNGQVKVN